MIEVILKSSVWLRGEEGSSGSVLFRPCDSKMCCYGVLAAQCGVPLSYLTDVSTYDEIHGSLPKELQVLDLAINEKGNSVAARSYATNDDVSIPSDEERVLQLNIINNPHGVNFTFVDDTIPQEANHA